MLFIATGPAHSTAARIEARCSMRLHVSVWLVAACQRPACTTSHTAAPTAGKQHRRLQALVRSTSPNVPTCCARCPAPAPAAPCRTAPQQAASAPWPAASWSCSGPRGQQGQHVRACLQHPTAAWKLSDTQVYICDIICELKRFTCCLSKQATQATPCQQPVSRPLTWLPSYVSGPARRPVQECSCTRCTPRITHTH